MRPRPRPRPGGLTHTVHLGLCPQRSARLATEAPRAAALSRLASNDPDDGNLFGERALIHLTDEFELLRVILGMERSRTYKLLEAFLPGVGVFVFLRADLVKPAWLRVHHGTRVLKHVHVETLPGTVHTSNQRVQGLQNQI